MASFLGNRNPGVAGLFSDDPPNVRSVSRVTGLPSSWNEQQAVAGVWDDARFSGQSLGIPVGVSKFRHLNNNGVHDKISSLKVKGGYKLTLFKDQEGGTPKNAMRTFTGPVEVAYVGDKMNDETSVISVEPTTEPGQTGDTTPGRPPPPEGDWSGQYDQRRRRQPVRRAPQQAGMLGGNMGNIIMIVGGIGLLGAAAYTVTQE